MRVITGKAKGVKLAAPSGDAVRPTTDRVKEAVFDVIQFDVEGRRVLDLFAGTGQMGIEALSRGAERVDFADNSNEAVRLVRENLDKTRLETSAFVFHTDYKAFVKQVSEKGWKYHLIFIDPPYENGFAEKALKLVEKFDILCPGGIIVCEGLRESAPFDAVYGSICKGREYNYGKTRVTMLHRLSGGVDA